MSEQVVYKVEGMDCGGCVKAVTRSITGMISGTSVDVDLDKGLVSVSGTATDSQVEEAVQMAGFTYGGRAA